MTKTDTRPLLHVELGVWFDKTEFHVSVLEDLEPDVAEYLRSECAELLVPYHTDEAKYGFTCFVAGIPNFQPAFVELMVLNRYADLLHKDLADRCRPFPEELNHDPD